MADCIAKFLTNFGMTRERDQMRQHVTTTVAAKPSPGSETLSPAEYLREVGIAKDERERGDVQAAFNRLTLLLVGLQRQPQGTEVGQGSYSHSHILVELGLCLRDVGQYVASEAQLREALAITDALVQLHPERQDEKRLHAGVLHELGTILRRQGHYAQAQQWYEQALTEYTAIQDTRNRAATLGDLGTLALEQRDYAQARMRHQQALEEFCALGESTMQAVAWYLLGRAAEEQEAWAEAERCYRESLILDEQQGNIAGAAMTCNQLGIVANDAGRPAEAEGWYRGALDRSKQVDANSVNHSFYLGNLAVLLVDEVQAGRAAKTRLVEARNYAEQAQRIREQPGVSAEVWNTFNILARIADLQDNSQEAQSYRQQERESYAAFAGNRYHIHQPHAALIAAIVAANRGEVQARTLVEAALPQLESSGWHIRSGVEQMGWGTGLAGFER